MQSPLAHPLAHRYPFAAQPVRSAVRTSICASTRRFGSTLGVWASLAVAMLAVTGCATSEIPHMAMHPESSQKRVRAVHHWDVLARDVAQQVAAKIAHWPAGEHPIFVQMQGQSGFEQGFGQLLMTQLVDKGVNLSTTPVPVMLHVAVQVVQHPSGANQMSAARWLVAHDIAVARGWASAGAASAINPPSSMAGAAAPAAPAVDTAPVSLSTVAPVQVTGASTPPTATPMHAAPSRTARSATQLPPGSIAGDARAWTGPEMSSDGLVYTEVLVTTSLESGDRYLARSSDVYYINAQDAVLYGAPVLPPAPPPVKGKTWQVVAP